jgi:DNA polymerase (family 10)
MTSRQVASILFNIATILEEFEVNMWRIRAYKRAARQLMRADFDMEPLARREEPLPIRGVGKRLNKKIKELVLTGQMSFYDELCDERIPVELREMVHIPGLGPKTASILHEKLGITTVSDLAHAAHLRKLREVKGFGEKRERAIAEYTTPLTSKAA